MVRVWEDGEDDSVYRFENIDLSSFATSTEFWIKFEANMSGIGDQFFVDDIEIVSQQFPTPIAEFSDTKGPAALFVDSSAITGGVYTIEFLNDSGVDVVSEPFSTSGSVDETWVYTQAYKDYLIRSEAGDIIVTAYVRQSPGPTTPATGQRVFIETWKPFGEPAGEFDDDDGDGIENLIDGEFVGESFTDESQIVSIDFTDQHEGGTTYGTITDPADLTITVQNASEPDGVLIDTSGGSGTATITICDTPVFFTDGDSGTFTCGSLISEVHAGTVEVQIAENVVTSIETGTQTEVGEIAPGTYKIENDSSSEIPVSVEVTQSDDITVTVPTDTTVIITIGGDGQVDIEQ